jgi:hypothetical protein
MDDSRSNIDLPKKLLRHRRRVKPILRFRAAASRIVRCASVKDPTLASEIRHLRGFE